MESRHPALEVVLIVLSLGAYVVYHLWFFFIKTGVGSTQDASKTYGINGKGKLARLMFTNGMMGASFQASIGALFFNQLLQVLLTPRMLRTLERYAGTDPLLRKESAALAPVGTDATAAPHYEDVRIGVVSAMVVVLVNLSVVLSATMFFVVCVRLYIHAGYYYRAAAHPTGLITVSNAYSVTLQAQVMYTLGQRLIFFFPITAMWLIGPTAMVVTSVVVTVGVFLLDRWDPKHPGKHLKSVLSPAASVSHSLGDHGSPRSAAVATSGVTGGGGGGGSGAARQRGMGGRTETPQTQSHAGTPGLLAPARDAAALKRGSGGAGEHVAQGAAAHASPPTPPRVRTSADARSAAANGASGASESLSGSSELLTTAHSSPLKGPARSGTSAGTAAHANEAYRA